MLLWLAVFTTNLFFAIKLAGTWQSAVSLFFVAVSLYYVVKDGQKKTS